MSVKINNQNVTTVKIDNSDCAALIVDGKVAYVAPNCANAYYERLFSAGNDSGKFWSEYNGFLKHVAFGTSISGNGKDDGEQTIIFNANFGPVWYNNISYSNFEIVVSTKWGNDTGGLFDTKEIGYTIVVTANFYNWSNTVSLSERLLSWNNINEDSYDGDKKSASLDLNFGINDNFNSDNITNGFYCTYLFGTTSESSGSTLYRNIDFTNAIIYKSYAATQGAGRGDCYLSVSGAVDSDLGTDFSGHLCAWSN